jgi:hypothetical protein
LAALDMALEVIDDDQVQGLVINAGSEAELVLSREEVGSLAHGKPLPLVGYIQQIPEMESEETLVAEPSDPPPPAFAEIVANCLAQFEDVHEHRLRRTFNPDRDREPHWSLSIRGLPDEQRRDEIAQKVIAAVEGKVPDPGYLDILFEEPTN